MSLTIIKLRLLSLYEISLNSENETKVKLRRFCIVHRRYLHPPLVKPNAFTCETHEYTQLNTISC